jgi:putative phosphoesterase
MKYAVISDVHSNLDALEAVIDEIPKTMPVLCLGDIVGYGPQPNEVIEVIQGLKPLVTLMGNHDYAVTTGDVEGFSDHAATAIAWTRQHITSPNLQFLSNLRSAAHFDVDNTQVALYHASPRDSLFEYVYPEIIDEEVKSLINLSKCRVVLLGHTHFPMRFSLESGLLANPGSVGQPRDGNPNASFGFLTISAGKCGFEYGRVEYDVDSTAAKISRAGLPSFLASRLYKGM